MRQKYFPKRREPLTGINRKYDINQNLNVGTPLINSNFLTKIIRPADFHHQNGPPRPIVLDISLMLVSKSFGYAVRGVLYVTVACKEKQRIQVDEIARELAVPKHFLSKVMKKIVKHGILHSTRGPYGGFAPSDKTLSTTLSELITITNNNAHFDHCLLQLKKCNALHPCPLHHRMEAYRNTLNEIYKKTTIEDLLDCDKSDLLKSISAAN